jgi:hypothetical protein
MLAEVFKCGSCRRQRDGKILVFNQLIGRLNRIGSFAMMDVWGKDSKSFRGQFVA